MSNNKKIVSNTNSTPTINTANNKNNNKSSYFNSTKKSHYGSQQSKPKMSNSLELISGSVSEVQKKYEILSDIVSEYQGKVHGSQSNVNGNNISLVVYYECPLGKRDEIKTLYNNRIRTLQRFSV
jgi:viroplasmin and RNaseH domain-containing protein